MKILLFLFGTTLGVTAQRSGRNAFLTPTRLLWSDLQSGKAQEILREALSEFGMVSIHGLALPSLSRLPDCMADPQEHVFVDGTIRQTLATHSIPNGMQKLHGLHLNKDSCEDTTLDLRSKVAKATHVFAEQVTKLLNRHVKLPLLETRKGYTFDDFASIVDNGEHLEHFHAYIKHGGIFNPQDEHDATIALHVDQGLFLAFTPGRYTDGTTTQGFVVQLKNGSLPEVLFSEQDELVFLLGDGIHQYVAESSALYPVPHALQLPPNDQPRVWYGRMVLPPHDAIHPLHPSMTFGELRQTMIEQAQGSDDKRMSIGCSSTLQARLLEESSCEAGTYFCWHRCMDPADDGVSVESCATRGLDLACTNPRGQVYVEGHGDYFMGCIDMDTAEDATPYPTLPDYPRENATCTDEAFAAFVQEQSSSYDFEANLTNGGYLQWIVVDDSIVRVRLAYNGLFGYLGFGFANTQAREEGKLLMLGGTVVLALSGGDYDAATGLDLSMDATVAEYVIDPTFTAFRHWMTPVSDEGLTVVAQQFEGTTTSSVGVESNECFSAMTFEKSGINGRPFNLAGSDTMIWAANGVDYFVGYHGSARGVLEVHWAEGEVHLGQHTHGDDDEHYHEGTSAATLVYVTKIGVAMVAFAFAAVMY